MKIKITKFFPEKYSAPSVKEVIEALQKIENQDMPVWLGVDAGEGWLPVRFISALPGHLCPIDGDENDGYVYTYLEEDDDPSKYKYVTEGNEMAGNDIAVIGCYYSIDDAVEIARKINEPEEVKKEEEEKKLQQLIKKQKQLEEELNKINSELKK